MGICREYILGLQMELARKELPRRTVDDQVILTITADTTLLLLFSELHDLIHIILTIIANISYISHT